MVNKRNGQETREPTEQIAVRVPLSVLGRIEAHATRLLGRNPGVRVSRADALRALVIASLDRVEAEGANTTT